MAIIKFPNAVFVPFEIQRKGEIKRDDLPRFLEPREVIQYLAAHPEVSTRRGLKVILEWREHSERDLIDEYLAGVGTEKFQRH